MKWGIVVHLPFLPGPDLLLLPSDGGRNCKLIRQYICHSEKTTDISLKCNSDNQTKSKMNKYGLQLQGQEIWVRD